MSSRLSTSRAVDRINKRGVLLMFPVQNRPLPLSLWSEFFPNSAMHWAWDEGSDHRVGDMWQLMKRLSDCRQVVYSKWYQGRATFFSRALFTAMLRMRWASGDPRRDLSPNARDLLEVLESNSPLSTRQVKEATGLVGGLHETAYHRALKELFRRLLVVGFGEVEDGAFPSLAMGSTELLFEDLCRDASEMKLDDAQLTLDRFMPEGSPFRRFFERSLVK